MKEINRSYAKGFTDCLDQFSDMLSKCRTVENAVLFTFYQKDKVNEMIDVLDTSEKEQCEVVLDEDCPCNDCQPVSPAEEETCCAGCDELEESDEFIFDLGDGKQLTLTFSQEEE